MAKKLEVTQAMGLPPQPEPAWMEDMSGSADNKLAGRSMISVARCNAKELGGVMGKAWRQAITGKVQIKAFSGGVDFCCADLWTRKSINGTVDQLAHDPYLFRPIPMAMRTWIYHHNFRDGQVIGGIEGSSEDAMIRHVLQMDAIDAAVSGGAWAPVMLQIPMVICLSLAADVSAVMASIAVVLFTLAVHFGMNYPRLYRFHRLVSFPARFFNLIWIALSMASDAETSGLALIGYFGALGLCALEILAGDGGAIWGARLLCNYEVLACLPNRLFVCRRHGAAHSADIVGTSLPVNEKLTGMGSWQDDFTLIADVKGLIMELRPMTFKDWKMMADEKQANEDHVHHYIGLDVYSPGAATIDAVNAAISEQMMLAKQKEGKDDMKVQDA